MTPTVITFRSDFDVELIDRMGDDLTVVRTARVSTQGAEADGDDNPGLINFLMRNRHGSPFEHVVFTWRISAPIFVWREFMRHRIASYNEESGRYRQLEPVFYIPAAGRPLQQVGKAGAYEFISGAQDQFDLLTLQMRSNSWTAYRSYEHLLDQGIAREVARMLLPVNIYSTAFVTMNARGLMNFLSLRTKHPSAAFPSFPQHEIATVAERMEGLWAGVMPDTHRAFCDNGRIAP